MRKQSVAYLLFRGGGAVTEARRSQADSTNITFSLTNRLSFLPVVLAVPI